MGDGKVAECRVYIDDLYSCDDFWSSLLENQWQTRWRSLPENLIDMTSQSSANPRTVVERFTQAITAQNLEAAVACFALDYWDEVPARRGESVVGRDQVRSNFAALFQEIPDLRADLLHAVTERDTVWVEWRMSGTRRDGTPMEFVGVNIFGVQDQQFVWGRIYTELVRDAGGIEAQIERMTKGESGRQP